MEVPVNLKWIENVEGINIQDGLVNCGMPKEYIKFVKTFYSTLDSRINDIAKAFEAGDLGLYTIRVHALKSTSRIMGAGKLSLLAEELEKAGGLGNKEIIAAKTPLLLDICRTYQRELSPIESLEYEDEITSNKVVITAEDLSNAYDALMDFASIMDYDAVEMVLSELKGYIIPENDEKILKAIEKDLRNMDWDGIEEILRSR